MPQVDSSAELTTASKGRVTKAVKAAEAGAEKSGAASRKRPAAKAGVEPNGPDEQARDAVVRQLIAERAYELWENLGRPHGLDLVNWCQAEQDIKASLEQEAARAKASSAKRTARPNPSRRMG